jgi:hypothetical protein
MRADVARPRRPTREARGLRLKVRPQWSNRRDENIPHVGVTVDSE